MCNITKHWNAKQSLLKQALKEGKADESKALLYELHSIVHSSVVYKKGDPSYLDEIFCDLSDKAFRSMPAKETSTIAWNIWHITRIEDITASILIADLEQVLNDSWQNKLNTGIKDTANAMSRDEIIAFSNEINMQELRNYRNAVGFNTKQIIENLGQKDLKPKTDMERIKRVLLEGGVIEHPDSIWLLDFWAKKNIAGLLLMPVTRHQIVHLNACKKLKDECSKMFTS